MERPEIPSDEYNKPVGSEMPPQEPLELLPEREWLNARISEVKYQVVLFNNAIQYVSYEDDDKKEVFVLDEAKNKIPRKEFEIKFLFDDYDLPNNKGKRKAWLTLGAAFGDRAHLPKFLIKVINKKLEKPTPEEIINQLEGVTVKLQLKNKDNKDGTKTYQLVVWDAVKYREELLLSKEQPKFDEDGNEIAWDE